MTLNEIVGKCLNEMMWSSKHQFLDDDLAYLLRDWRDEKTLHMKTRKRNLVIKFMDNNDIPYRKDIARLMTDA